MAASIDAETLAKLKEETLECARNKGLLIQGRPAPLSLLPTKFPRNLFQLYAFAVLVWFSGLFS